MRSEKLYLEFYQEKFFKNNERFLNSPIGSLVIVKHHLVTHLIMLTIKDFSVKYRELSS